MVLQYSDVETQCPSDSEWSDEDDDGTFWWSGMHNRRPKRATSVAAASAPNGGFFNPTGRGLKDYDGEHYLKDAAAMMLMSILYPARLARFDLLKPVGFLAKCITRWDGKCDARLHQLMCYINTTLSDRMVGYVGDHPRVLTARLYCDADFAGCPYTLKSTSGVHAAIEGPNTRFPWAASSKGQSAIAQSTPEAELASLNEGMREKGESALSIWQAILWRFHAEEDSSWKMKVNLHEDNTTCIHCVRCGNHTMKTLERNFGCKVSWMNDVVMGPKQDGQGSGYVLVHTGSKHMAADIYTKSFTDKATFGNLKQLINVFKPEQIKDGAE